MNGRTASASRSATPGAVVVVSGGTRSGLGHGVSRVKVSCETLM